MTKTIKMDVVDGSLGGKKWIYLAQDRKNLMLFYYGNETSYSIKCTEFLD
jgi:hypothetical protein